MGHSTGVPGAGTCRAMQCDAEIAKATRDRPALLSVQTQLRGTLTWWDVAHLGSHPDPPQLVAPARRLLSAWHSETSEKDLTSEFLFLLHRL